MLTSIKTTILLLAIILISTVSYSQDNSTSTNPNPNDVKPSDALKTQSVETSTDEPAGIKMNDGILYGKNYDENMQVINFSDFMTNANANDNNGKVVLLKGNVSEVCQEMGCWMMMSEGKDKIRVTTSHNFFLPKDIAGSNAIVIGTFKVTEISEEEARHYNEESKNPAVKTEDIKGPQKEYEIEAFGIKILNPEIKPDNN